VEPITPTHPRELRTHPRDPLTILAHPRALRLSRSIIHFEIVSLHMGSSPGVPHVPDASFGAPRITTGTARRCFREDPLLSPWATSLNFFSRTVVTHRGGLRPHHTPDADSHMGTRHGDFNFCTQGNFHATSHISEQLHTSSGQAGRAIHNLLEHRIILGLCNTCIHVTVAYTHMVGLESTAPGR
jgi:hypothetical protein